VGWCARPRWKWCWLRQDLASEIQRAEGDGEIVFRHACNLGLEGIVSKRKDSPYRSGLIGSK
jgi:ATP-dependent DNA ligase